MKGRPVRHGHCSGGPSSTYSCWLQMWARCTKPYNSSYHNYGARGIAVCDRWRSFAAFLEDMGARPPGLSIERVDNDGDYTPSNCKWATRTEQSRNTRLALKVTLNGETKSLSEWCDLRGLNKSTVLKRIHRSGWSIEDALSTALCKGRRYG